MPDLDALHARRAQEHARRRRLRGLALVVLLGAIAGIAVVLVGPSRPSPRSVARRPTSPAASAGPRPRAVESAAARGMALGIANIRRLAALGLPVYCAGPHGDDVAFTFDDGPGPYTDLALRKLSQAHERATFFVVGRSMGFFPGRVASELAVAAIGDHTAHHLFLPGLSPAAIRAEIASTRAQIQRNVAQKTYLFRPPYGARNRVVDMVAKRLGMLDVLWTVDSADSLGANWLGIIANVEHGLRPGAIILMHENRGQTIRALTILLPYLHRHHWRSVSLPELFASDPPSVAQLRAGARGCGVARPARTGA